MPNTAHASMPRTADWRGLSNPFDVIAALKASAAIYAIYEIVLAISVLRLRPIMPACNGFRTGFKRLAKPRVTITCFSCATATVSWPTAKKKRGQNESCR